MKPTIIKTDTGTFQFFKNRKHSSGSSSNVYRGTDENGHEVAIKQLKPELQTSPILRERFVREQAWLGELQKHYNIINIVWCGDFEGSIYIIMNFVPHTLRDLMDTRTKHQTPLTLLEIVNQIAIPIAGALAYAHGNDIIHRDVKPSNILIQHNKEKLVPLLADFGIAYSVRVPRITDLGQHSPGTFHYLPPEIMRQYHNPNSETITLWDTHSDVWSFGVMLYELSMGMLPFQDALETGNPAASIINAPHQKIKRMYPDIGGRLFSDLVDKMLAKDYRERLNDFDKIIDELNVVQHALKTNSIPSFYRWELDTQAGKRIEENTSKYNKLALILSLCAVLCAAISILPPAISAMIDWNSQIDVTGTINAVTTDIAENSTVTLAGLVTQQSETTDTVDEITPTAIQETATPDKCIATSAEDNPAGFNVRERNAEDASLVSSVPYGELFYPIGQNNSWYYGSYNAIRGWVADWVVITYGDCQSLSFIPAPPEPTATPGETRNNSGNSTTGDGSGGTTGRSGSTGSSSTTGGSGSTGSSSTTGGSGSSGGVSQPVPTTAPVNTTMPSNTPVPQDTPVPQNTPCPTNRGGQAPPGQCR